MRRLKCLVHTLIDIYMESTKQLKPKKKTTPNKLNAALNVLFALFYCFLKVLTKHLSKKIPPYCKTRVA